VDSFTSFVQARGGPLWRAAWLLTGDRALAEDLLQTALVKAWPHYERVAEGGSFEAYVRRALVTTYATWCRRRWRSELPSGSLPDAPASPVAPASAASPETAYDVQRALATLSPQQRAVVVLRYFADLTEADTAAALGCSVGAVKSHHSRAIRRLRVSGLLASIEEEA
jgi:RNA polymerase sigma-70 factor (sigma-E family)